MSRSRFVALWFAAVVATSAAFVVHLSMRFQNVRLGYAVSALRTKQRELLEVKRALEIEAETLRDPARVERIARDSLQMEIATPARIVPIARSGATERRTAGRIR